MDNKHKHLTLDERFTIKHGLDNGEPFKTIAKKIGKDCTTISKEVRARKTFVRKGAFGLKFNDCARRFDCGENNICAGKPCRGRLCRNCRDVPFCGKLCSLYERELCKKVKKPPYVCGKCGQRHKCTLEKHVYDPKHAQNEYEALRHAARAGFDLDGGEVERLDAIVSPLLRQGQSLHHIRTANAARIMLSERTLYNYVGAGLFAARNIDMPRKVRFKRRKSRPAPKADPGFAVGRAYSDYLAFMGENPDTAVVEADTVHGRQGGKALLTLHFVRCSFMLAFLIDGLAAADVNGAVARLRRSLGSDLFSKLIPILLTDRGPEFTDPKSIEFDEEGEGLTRVFYCEPNMAQQKGALENNHTFLRRVVPKGHSFDGFCQADITLMMNHINSYARKALNDVPPMVLFQCIYGDDVLKKLGAALIPPDKITLHPNLLKK